ncbi:hypothetical protein [Kribbella speibonae]|uniref:Uncharacterized protein n=1 Tax=Kribbella speibonae TaxID=1572660 RepID=A0ABY1ZUU1_9ACTN|nr:hypothetical protein [Kribbella speibonae]TCC17497.1 hypothetical protein E0H58_37690 [Kribbella speibonae]
MIDEKILSDRLTDAAAAQDDLLPRSPAEDLTAGRRRLRVRRLLAGTSATVAVLAVGAVGSAVLSPAETQTATPPESQRAEMLLRAQTFQAHRPAGELQVARYLNLLLQSVRTPGRNEPEYVAGALGAVKVELTTFGTARRGSCAELLSMPTCSPAALPDRGRGQYAEGPDGTKYVRTARYEWPVGGEIVIRVTYPTKPSAKSDPTRAVVLGLVADPLFYR